MRGYLLSCVLLVVGCADDEDGEEPGGACREAYAIHEEALKNALEAQPACTSDDDCIIMTGAVACNGFDTNDCGFAAHRDTPTLYEEQEPRERICEVMANSRYGCSLGPACAPREGRVACVEEACVILEP